MRWGVQVLPHAIVVRMFGILDQTVGEMFEKTAERASNLKNRQVVFDFSDVENIDPIALVLCGYGFHHLRQLGIPAALVQPSEWLLPLLQEHGLPEIPPVFLEAQSLPSRN